MSDVTQIICEIENGDPTAAERLLPLIYDALRQLAAQQPCPREAWANTSGDRACP